MACTKYGASLVGRRIAQGLAGECHVDGTPQMVVGEWRRGRPSLSGNGSTGGPHRRRPEVQPCVNLKDISDFYIAYVNICPAQPQPIISNCQIFVARCISIC